MRTDITYLERHPGGTEQTGRPSMGAASFSVFLRFQHCLAQQALWSLPGAAYDPLYYVPNSCWGNYRF